MNTIIIEYLKTTVFAALGLGGLSGIIQRIDCKMNCLIFYLTVGLFSVALSSN